MLIDDVTIKVRAGDGGDGVVGFSKVPKVKGPTGAAGGNGGNVYLEGVSDLGALEQFRYKKELEADSGGQGDRSLHDGARGEDLIIRVPVGTVVHYLGFQVPISHEILKKGDRLLVAKGGRGGRGNWFFRSSRNTTPKEFEHGEKGEEKELRLELKLIADVGFVGLPNVGKTSLLNEITNTKSKVANYQFTTLEPNIGVYYDLILADIPGLIEGASKGKGLGIKFLRHIERTNILFHFIAADSEDVEKDYTTIRNELETYSPELASKKEHLFISKSDTVSTEELKEKEAILKKHNKTATSFSLYDDESIKKVTDILNGVMKEKNMIS